MRASLRLRFLGWSLAFGGFLPGCQVSTIFKCSDGSDCGDSGTCEAIGVCSFPDAGCDSGRRYGRFAGAVSGQCSPGVFPGGTTSDTVGEDAGLGEGETTLPGLDTSDSGADGEGTTGSVGDGPNSTTGSEETGVDPTSVTGDSAGTTGDSMGTTGMTTGVSTGGSSGGSTAGTSEGTGSGGTGGAPETCTELFGDFAGYVSCGESEVACTFFNLAEGGSCDDVCARAGRPCLAAWDNIVATACDFDVDRLCNARGLSDHICQCGLEPGATLPSCDAIYAGLAGYVLCEEQIGDCRFQAQTAGQSCDGVCAGLGGICIRSWVPGSTACEPPGAATGCAVVRDAQICECTRG